MNHGPFYLSAELVVGVHRDADGIFAGYRAVHAFGRSYAGTCTATPVAKTLSGAVTTSVPAGRRSFGLAR